MFPKNASYGLDLKVENLVLKIWFLVSQYISCNPYCTPVNNYKMLIYYTKGADLYSMLRRWKLQLCWQTLLSVLRKVPIVVYCWVLMS